MHLTIDSSENLIVFDSVENKESIVEKVVYNQPIEILNIKNNKFIITTSGVASKSRYGKFCYPKKNGFFGSYQLIYQNNVVEKSLGVLTVFVPDKPENWKEDNDYEKFCEIKLHSNEINVWNELSVGDNKEKLSSLYNQKYLREEGDLIYFQLDDFSLITKINSDTIEEIIVGKYCDFQVD